MALKCVLPKALVYCSFNDQSLQTSLLSEFGTEMIVFRYKALFGMGKFLAELLGNSYLGELLMLWWQVRAHLGYSARVPTSQAFETVLKNKECFALKTKILVLFLIAQ